MPSVNGDITHLKRQKEYHLQGIHNVFKVPAYTLQFVFCGSFLICLFSGHLKTSFPMISDGIAGQPFSGAFTLLNIPSFACGVLGFIILYVKIELLNRKQNCDNPVAYSKIQFMNKLNLVVGWIPYIGLSIGAAFPLEFHKGSEYYDYVTFYPHTVGAITAIFGFFLSYACSTYVFSLVQPNGMSSRSLRIAFLIMSAVSEAIGAFCLCVFVWESQGTLQNTFVWRHLIPQICKVVFPINEWIIAVVFSSFAVILSKDIEDIKVTVNYSIEDDCEDESLELKKES